MLRWLLVPWWLLSACTFDYGRLRGAASGDASVDTADTRADVPAPTPGADAGIAMADVGTAPSPDAAKPPVAPDALAMLDASDASAGLVCRIPPGAVCCVCATPAGDTCCSNLGCKGEPCNAGGPTDAAPPRYPACAQTMPMLTAVECGAGATGSCRTTDGFPCWTCPVSEPCTFTLWYGARGCENMPNVCVPPGVACVAGPACQ